MRVSGAAMPDVLSERVATLPVVAQPSLLLVPWRQAAQDPDAFGSGGWRWITLTRRCV